MYNICIKDILFLRNKSLERRQMETNPHLRIYCHVTIELHSKCVNVHITNTVRIH